MEDSHVALIVNANSRLHGGNEGSKGLVYEALLAEMDYDLLFVSNTK